MQLVLLCVLVLSLLQPGLLQNGGTEDTLTNGGGGDFSQRHMAELKNIVLAQSKQIAHFSREVRDQLASLNATVNTLQGQLESLAEELVRNRQKINEVNNRTKTIESEQVVSQETFLQVAKCSTTDELSTGLSQLRRELTTDQRTIGERISSQERIQNETTAQLQIVHSTIETQLANATHQLSTVLNKLRTELTTNQQSSDLALNRTQERIITLLEQCQQMPLETPKDPLNTSGEQNYTCGGSPGWHRVAFLNMSDPSQDCPSGWSLTTHSVRTCGRLAHSGWYTCDPVTFPVSGGEYSRVCGRITAYQYGVGWAFTGAYSRYTGREGTWDPQSLNGSYVDGISITHGLLQQHIWTFAAGLAQKHCCGGELYHYCHCDIQSQPYSYEALPPSFVGNDYFCEAAISEFVHHRQLYSENPLWDGQNCGQNSTCCSMNNPPYFMKDLPAPTTDDIEVRLCSILPSRSTDYPIELLEIYVK